MFMNAGYVVILLVLMSVTGCATSPPVTITAPPVTVTKTVTVTPTPPPPPPPPPVTVTVTSTPSISPTPIAKQDYKNAIAGALQGLSWDIPKLTATWKIQTGDNWKSSGNQTFTIAIQQSTVYDWVMDASAFVQSTSHIGKANSLASTGKLPGELREPYASASDINAELKLAIMDLERQISIVKSDKQKIPVYVESIYESWKTKPVPMSPDYRDKAIAEGVALFDAYLDVLTKMLDTLKLASERASA